MGSHVGASRGRIRHGSRVLYGKQEIRKLYSFNFILLLKIYKYMHDLLDGYGMSATPC